MSKKTNFASTSLQKDDYGRKTDENNVSNRTCS